MIPIDQDKFSSHEDPTVKGNCFSACIASLLEIPLEEVPHFAFMPQAIWFNAFFQFMKSRGYQMYGTIYPPHYENMDIAWAELLRRSPGVDGYFIVSGGSFRGFSEGHACIYKNGKLAHDPHPSRSGLDGETALWLIEKAREDPDARS